MHENQSWRKTYILRKEVPTLPKYKYGKITAPIDFKAFKDAMEHGKFVKSKMLSHKSFLTFIYWFGVRKAEALERMKEEFKGKPVKFFLINVGEDKDKIKTFLKNKNINLTILLDRFQKTAEKFDALKLPRLFILDKNGIIHKSQKGFTNPEIFENEMRTIITKLVELE